MEIPPPPKTEAERSALREHFLEPETRCDTFVSVRTKKVWMKMLDILEQIMAICERHDLRWTVTSGTLLGAIRHGGFIPWDEDLDIAMPRKDFNAFQKLAPDELRFPYSLENWITEDDAEPAFARVRNGETASILNAYAERHRLFNQGIFVDIYPLDGIPDGRIARRMYEWLVWNIIRTRKQSLNPPTAPSSGWKDSVRRAVHRVVGTRFLFCFLNALTARNPFEQCLMCGLTPYNFYEGLWRNSRCPSEWFLSTEKRDCEYLVVNVPAKWEKVLAAYYGNWRRFVKGTCNHDGELLTDPDRSYREILPEQFARYGYTKADFK